MRIYYLLTYILTSSLNNLLCFYMRMFRNMPLASWLQLCSKLFLFWEPDWRNKCNLGIQQRKKVYIVYCLLIFKTLVEVTIITFALISLVKETDIDKEHIDGIGNIILLQGGLLKEEEKIQPIAPFMSLFLSVCQLKVLPSIFHNLLFPNVLCLHVIWKFKSARILRFDFPSGNFLLTL